jgi:IS5 family transposase
METVAPWSRLEGLIEPFYPKSGNGRPPVPLGTMLRIHFMRQWFGYSDPAMEEGLHDVPLLRQFAGLTEKQKAFNRMLSAVRAIVEHPFRVVKRPFGFVKVRYRGLAKNTAQIVTLFARANLWLARKRLLSLMGEVRP